MLNKIQEDIKAAMRNKEKVRVQTLRSIINDLKNAGIEKKGAEKLVQEVSSPAEYLSEQEIVKVIHSAAKRRRESIEQYQSGGRMDLASQEEAELSILSEFLPQPLTPEELKVLVEECILEAKAEQISDMGKVMKIAQAKADGRVDGKALSVEVREQLS